MADNIQQKKRGGDLLAVTLSLVVGLFIGVSMPAGGPLQQWEQRAHAQNFLREFVDHEKQRFHNSMLYVPLTTDGIAVPDDVARHYTVKARTQAPDANNPADALDARLDALLAHEHGADDKECGVASSPYLLVKAVPIGKRAEDGILVTRGLCAANVRTVMVDGIVTTAERW